MQIYWVEKVNQEGFVGVRQEIVYVEDFNLEILEGGLVELEIVTILGELDPYKEEKRVLERIIDMVRDVSDCFKPGKTYGVEVLVPDPAFPDYSLSTILKTPILKNYRTFLDRSNFRATQYKERFVFEGHVSNLLTWKSVLKTSNCRI